MNKHFIVIGTAVLLLAVGLSGCMESDNFINTNNVEVLDYSVISYKFAKNVLFEVS